MKNKREAIEALAQDCQLVCQYLDAKGQTCALGRLAQLAGVPDETLRLAGSAVIDIETDRYNRYNRCKTSSETMEAVRAIVKAIQDKFGLDVHELARIQEFNDNCNDDEQRPIAVAGFVSSFPADDQPTTKTT